MEILHKILSRQEFVEEPPVLMDIGAALLLHEKWKEIAKYSICVAFDADNRNMEYEETETDNYKKLYTLNCIVSDKETGEANFHLTKYPSCSSLLMPDKKSLHSWSFGKLFEVEKVVKLNTITLSSALNKLNLKKIDWIKVDAQGADLRLFSSLGDDLISKILMAEFEPGILDAYLNEDKLCTLMQYMEKLPFWVSDIVVKGSQRINQDIIDSRLTEDERKAIPSFLKTSPGYAEITYLNSFKKDSCFTKRDFLLGWIISMMEEQYGFAMEISITASQKFDDEIFNELESYSLKTMKNNKVKLPNCNSLKVTLENIAYSIYKKLKGS